MKIWINFEPLQFMEWKSTLILLRIRPFNDLLALISIKLSFVSSKFFIHLFSPQANDRIEKQIVVLTG